MQLPLAQLPDHVQQAIAPFVGPLPWHDVELFIQQIPQSTAPAHAVLSCNTHYPRVLTAIAMTIGTDIYINPSFVDFDTAAGLALLVHEGVHVRQFQEVPNFLGQYNQANQGVPDDKPWLNPYELEAYLTECEAWHYYMSLGLPSGRWKPLGVMMGFCN